MSASPIQIKKMQTPAAQTLTPYPMPKSTLSEEDIETRERYDELISIAIEADRYTRVANGLQNYNDLSKGSAFVIEDRGEIVFPPYYG